MIQAAEIEAESEEGESEIEGEIDVGKTIAQF